MNKPQSALLALVAVFFGGVCYYQWSSASIIATALDETTKDRDALRHRVAELEKRVQAAQDETAAVRAEAPPIQRATSIRNGTVTSSKIGTADSLPGPMQAMESPEMRRLMAVEQKGRLDARYAPLFKSLGLAPSQLDRLKQLLVDKQNAAMDVMAAARAQGLTGPDSRSQIQALTQQTNSELDASIRNLLGDSAYQQFQQFDRTQQQRAIVDQLASRLSYTDSPLSSAQADQMVQLLAVNSPAPSAGNTGDIATGSASVRYGTVVRSSGGPAAATTIVNVLGGGSGAPITSDALSQAQSVLTPTQLNALQQLQAEQQAQQQMGQIMRQSLGDQGIRISTPSAGSGPPSPAPGG